MIHRCHLPPTMTSLTFAYLGLGMIAVAAVLATTEHLWLSKAQVTQGTVVEIIRTTRGTGSRMGGIPRIRFRAADGTEHEFKRGFSSRPIGMAVGDQVPVAYDPRTYAGRILWFGHRFGFPLGLASAGLALVCVCGGLTLGRKLVPRIYQERQEARPF